MSSVRDQVAAWVTRVTATLAEQEELDAAEYQRLGGEERWHRVSLACRGVTERLTDEQRARIEHEAEADRARYAEIIRQIRARLHG